MSSGGFLSRRRHRVGAGDACPRLRWVSRIPPPLDGTFRCVIFPNLNSPPGMLSAHSCAANMVPPATLEQHSPAPRKLKTVGRARNSHVWKVEEKILYPGSTVLHAAFKELIGLTMPNLDDRFATMSLFPSGLPQRKQ